MRRLLERNKGPLPPQAIVRFWRELFGAALIIEGGQTMAVCDGEGGPDRLALAREHFGPLTPVRRHHNPAQTLADLARERRSSPCCRRWARMRRAKAAGGRC